MEKEIWKDVIGYEGLYQVSNLGRVKSLPRFRKTIHSYISKEKILSPRKVGKDREYLSVLLQANCVRRNFKIHRLVAAAFIPNPKGYKEINHKDENKGNNRVENLEWCSRSYNINYGSWKSQLVKRFGKPVIQYTLDGEFVGEYKSMGEAYKITGIHSANICKCCKGIIGHTGNYFWRYKE